MKYRVNKKYYTKQQLDKVEKEVISKYKKVYEAIDTLNKEINLEELSQELYDLFFFHFHYFKNADKGGAYLCANGLVNKIANFNPAYGNYYYGKMLFEEKEGKE